MATAEDKRCFICLCGEGERAPFCSAKESADFISPCTCSLLVHRKCFLSWVSSLSISNMSGSQTSPFGVRPPLRWQSSMFFGTPAGQADANSGAAAGAAAGAAPAYRPSIFEIFTGAPSRRSDKMYVFVDCPQCRRRICLATKNSKILSARRGFQQIMDRFGAHAAVTIGLPVLGLGLLGTVIIALGACGQVILDVLAKPSVQLELYGVSIFPAMSVTDAIEQGIVQPHKFVSLTCYLPVYAMYLNSSTPFGIQNDFMFSLTSLALFNDPLGQTDTVAYKLMRSLTFIKIGARVLYNLTVNKLYYRWHKQIQPCFFADNLSYDDAQWIQQEVENDMDRENKEEEERQRDETFPFVLRLLRRAYRGVKNMFKSFYRDTLICTRVDFSSMFDSRSFASRVISTAVLPKLGQLFSEYCLSKLPWMNGYLSQFTETPDEALFFRNLIGCGVVMLARETVSFGLNYIRYRQLQSIDVDKDPTDFANDVARMYTLTEQEAADARAAAAGEDAPTNEFGGGRIN